MSYKFRNPFRYTPKVWDPPKGEKIPRTAREAEKIFHKKKVVPKHLEKLFYETIEYFPELKDTYIFVVEEKFHGVQHTLRSYPPLLSLFSKREDRVSPIVINTNKNTPIPFYSLTHDQQKGALAHEFAHMVDYSKRTSPELVGLAFMFCLSKNFAKKLERDTDEIVIERGCGKNLLELRNHIKEKATGSYGLYKRVIYGHTTISGWKSVVFSISYTIDMSLEFIIVLGKMIMLVYIKKVYKKSKA